MLITLSMLWIPLIRLCRPGHRPGAVDLLMETLGQDVLDQGRLARPGYPGDHGEQRQGKVDGEVLEVVLGGSDDGDRLAAAGPANQG